MINIRKTFASSLLLLSTLAFASDSHWGYEGQDSPEHWGELNDEYKLCANGQNQSPINITSSLHANLKPIKFHYTTSPNEILNNGHTVQINIDKGSYIEVDGEKYELLQYHFHTPSENNIHGKSYPLELHLVHASKDNHLAVVGVMFDRGEPNSQLEQLWAHMPYKTGQKERLKSVATDLNKLLPKDRAYYRFNGSLTTPPCTEGVKWFVLSHPMSISKDEVKKFEKAVHGHNNRPIQSLNARTIVD
ncbi:MAG: carbonic anhydrase family protein [Campylobacterota bacterium]|nr:carbonic anhydrase family protein [Campylobacterota bacterium]